MNRNKYSLKGKIWQGMQMKADLYLLILLMLLVFLSGCIQKESNTQAASDDLSKRVNPEKDTSISATGKVNVGVIQSLTGDLSSVGLPIVDSIKLAAKEINANGGILGNQVDLVIEDDQTLNIAAIDAAEKLLKMDRVTAIIGATGSGPSMSIMNITTKNGVLQMSSSNTGVEFTTSDDRDLYFRTCASDALQGVAMAKLAKQRGYNTASTLVVNNPYGSGYEDVFIKAFKAQDGKVLQSIRYDPTQTIFEQEVEKVFSVRPECVLLVSYPETGSQILKTAYQNGYLKDAHWLMSEGLKVDKIADMVGKDSNDKFIVAGLEGLAPFQSESRTAYQAFKDKFVNEYGREPTLYCSNSYDAMALVALAMEEAKSIKGSDVRDHLRSVANPPGIEVSDIGKALNLIREGKKINYQGASGDITFDEHGDVNATYNTWSFADNGSILLGDTIIS
jgi:neutral amino acid transport system substrate-binding protein